MKKNDLILIGSILIIAITILIGQHFWQKSNTGNAPMVVVTIDGQETMRLPLNQDYSTTIQLGEDQYNELVIKSGKASISEASCPDKICVHHRDIKYQGETIVCLPHKLVISIEGGEASEVDAIAN